MQRKWSNEPNYSEEKLFPQNSESAIPTQRLDASFYNDSGQFSFDCIFGILTDDPFSLFLQKWAEGELLTLQSGSTGDMCQTVLAAQGLDYSQLRENTLSAR